jgi:hypothetical protein
MKLWLPEAEAALTAALASPVQMNA